MKNLKIMDSETNEFFLFHGTKKDDIARICKDGFDARLSGTSAGRLFGYGTYLTPNFSKADHYTEDRTSSKRLKKDAVRTVIVVRAALGAPYRLTAPNPEMTVPPPHPVDGAPYDSVFAPGIQESGVGGVDWPEAIVSRDSQLLPAFLVDYKHMNSCTCSECLKRPA